MIPGINGSPRRDYMDLLLPKLKACQTPDLEFFASRTEAMR